MKKQTVLAYVLSATIALQSAVLATPSAYATDAPEDSYLELLPVEDVQSEGEQELEELNEEEVEISDADILEDALEQFEAELEYEDALEELTQEDEEELNVEDLEEAEEVVDEYNSRYEVLYEDENAPYEENAFDTYYESEEYKQALAEAEVASISGVQSVTVTYMNEITKTLTNGVQYIPIPVTTVVKAMYLPGESLPFDSSKYVQTSGSTTNSFFTSSAYSSLTPRYHILNKTSSNFGFDTCDGMFVWDTTDSCWRYWCDGGGVKNMVTKLYDPTPITTTITASNIKVVQNGTIFENVDGTNIKSSEITVTVTVNGSVITLSSSEYSFADSTYDTIEGDTTITINYGGIYVALELDLTPVVEDKTYDGQSYEDLVHQDATIVYYNTDEDGKATGEPITSEDMVNVGTYVAVLTYDNETTTHTFEVNPKPIYFMWDGGPYEYNSLEHIPTSEINQAYLVLREGETEIEDCEILETETTIVSTKVTATEKRPGIEAGTHNIAVTKLSNPNYTPATTSSYNFVVTQKEIYATITDLVAEYDGTKLSPTVTLVGVCDDVNEVTDDVYGEPNPTVVNPGSYSISVSLAGGHANNYILASGTDATFTVNKMPVSFEIEDQIVEAGTAPTITATASDANGTANDRVEVDPDYTVSYVDKDGNVYQGPNVPTTPGTYDVYIGLDNDNLYRHESTTNSDAIKVGAIIVVGEGESTNTDDYKKSLVTLTYDDKNTVSTVTNVENVVSGTMEVLQTPTKEGYTFVGWKYSNKMYYAGETFEITKNCTLEAVWAKNTTGAFGGTITTPTTSDDLGGGTGSSEDDDNEGSTGTGNGGLNGGTTTEPLAGATVSLWEGDRLVAQTVTDENGNYDFGFEVPDGIYNLEATKDGTTTTGLVEVSKGQPSNTDLEVSDDGKNSIVEVLPGMSGGVVVGGVDDLASNLEGEGNYTVKVDEEISSDFETALDDVIKGDSIVVDVEISKDGVILDSVDGELQVVVKLPQDMQLQSTYNVYIQDEETGEIVKLTQKPNENGEYYTLSSDRTSVIIYTNKTETFVIESISSTSNLTVSTNGYVKTSSNEGGSVTASASTAKAGTTVTIYPTIEEGYTLENLYITDADGNNVGLTANSDGSYSFVQPQGDGVTVEGIFAPIDGTGNGTSGGFDNIPEGSIGVYNPNGTGELILPDVNPDADIYIKGPSGEILGTYPGDIGGGITLPELELGDGQELEGWYATTDPDGNIVLSPIVTSPTMSEADLGGNPGDGDGNPGDGGGNPGDGDGNPGDGDGYPGDGYPGEVLPESDTKNPGDGDGNGDGDGDGNPSNPDQDDDTKDKDNGDNTGLIDEDDDERTGNIDEDDGLRNPNGTFVPQTNDSLTFVIWFLVMAVSAIAIMLFNRKKI